MKRAAHIFCDVSSYAAYLVTSHMSLALFCRQRALN